MDRKLTRSIRAGVLEARRLRRVAAARDAEYRAHGPNGRGLCRPHGPIRSGHGRIEGLAAGNTGRLRETQASLKAFITACAQRQPPSMNIYSGSLLKKPPSERLMGGGRLEPDDSGLLPSGRPARGSAFRKCTWRCAAQCTWRCPAQCTWRCPARCARCALRDARGGAFRRCAWRCPAAMREAVRCAIMDGTEE